MLVDIDQELSVTETFTLGRFGEVVLSSGGRLVTPTNVVAPGADAIAMQAANDRNRIVLDDGDNRQNIDPTVYPTGGLSASNTLRIGDTTDGGTFVLEQRFGTYRLQPTATLPTFEPTNPRPAGPDGVGGTIKVASMNVLNYFTTLDTNPGSGNGPDICGPSLLECRGANTTFELDRQRAKILSALIGLDADVVGLMEIENNDEAAVKDLVDGLNEILGDGTYDFIDTGTIGTDAIKVAFIYQPASATPVGDYAILDSTVDPRFIDTCNRPALAQTFESTATGGQRPSSSTTSSPRDRPARAIRIPATARATATRRASPPPRRWSTGSPATRPIAAIRTPSSSATSTATPRRIRSRSSRRPGTRT